MAAERHLILQELILRPSGEWTPQLRGWLVVRVASGAGYWLHEGTARELNVGDGFVVGPNVQLLLRASQLGSLKFQFFTIQPEYLNGLLSVSEWRQLETVSTGSPKPVAFFSASEPTAQKFSRIVELPHDHELFVRCALLQLWSGAIHGLLTATVESNGGNKLQERFQELVGRMTEAELADASLASLAGQLHCSERHFSRLFREEFGVPLRTRQIELRLQRALQLLADSNAKIINVAYDSGYRHLGLFNAMFKKRFGVTPSEWRQQNAVKNPAAAARNNLSRTSSGTRLVLALFALLFQLNTFAQTSDTNDSPAVASARAALYQKMAEQSAADQQVKIETEKARVRQQTEAIFGPVHEVVVSTNAGPHFKVENYLVTGNTVLAPGMIGGILTNVPAAFGTNVTFEAIQAALGDLQMAYRERGFVTVSVRLPPQKLTNSEVKVQVTEARLAAINVTGNKWFSTENVLRALPSLHTNMLLNSHVFQRELDLANASRDRTIYPVIGPGPEPGTSALTLKVKDTFPLHGRVELNNSDATPGTPALRVNSSVQYDNLWDLNHQVGVQYSFSPDQFKGNDYFSTTPFDDPQVASYSGYYRVPLANPYSVEKQVESNPTSFGYSEVNHKFNLPPATGQPDLTFYASRSTSDTGVKFGDTSVVSKTELITILSQDSGDNLTMNEGIGGRLSMPLSQFFGINSTLSVGLDFKDYNQASYNTNNFSVTEVITNGAGQPQPITIPVTSPQPTRYTDLQYLPLNMGWNASIPDKLGTTFFNMQANINLAVLDSYNKSVRIEVQTNGLPPIAKTTITHGGFSQAAYSTNAQNNFVTVQAGMTRDQNIYKEWSVRLHADGQWADTPLISNEQYGMGGPAGVRGYQSGIAYGDTGWRITVEPRTPQVSLGMAGNHGDEVPVWVRGSVFLDYGQLYRLDPTPGTTLTTATLLGVGWGLTANIGNHLDARVSMAWPLLSNSEIPGGSAYVYFAVGAQF